MSTRSALVSLVSAESKLVFYFAWLDFFSNIDTFNASREGQELSGGSAMCFVFPEYALIFNTRLIIVLNFWEAFQHSPKTTGEKLKKIHSVD